GIILRCSSLLLLVQVFRRFMYRLPATSPLFPYTTLFRSQYAFEQMLFHFLIHVTLNTHKILAVNNRRRMHQLVGKFTIVGEQQRSEEHTSELQSRENLVCRLLLEKKNDLDIVSPQRFEIS